MVSNPTLRSSREKDDDVQQKLHFRYEWRRSAKVPSGRETGSFQCADTPVDGVISQRRLIRRSPYASADGGRPVYAIQLRFPHGAKDAKKRKHLWRQLPPVPPQIGPVAMVSPSSIVAVKEEDEQQIGDVREAEDIASSSDEEEAKRLMMERQEARLIQSVFGRFRWFWGS